MLASNVLCATSALTVLNYAKGMDEGPYEAEPSESVLLELSGYHNLWRFDSQSDYDTCNFDKAVQVKGAQSGGTMTLDAPAIAGNYYYACQIDGHCASNAKFIIRVANAPVASPPPPSPSPNSILVYDNVFNCDTAIDIK